MERTPRTLDSDGREIKSRFAKPTALVVDDETAMREFVSMVLRENSFLPITACSATEALAVSARTEQPIDVLISDVQLGDGNGIEVAARIQSSRADIAVLLISGKPEYGEEADARHYAFLPKPFLPLQLLAALDRVFTDSRQASGEASSMASADPSGTVSIARG